ncbi:threonine/serine exporter family protein [Kitasatospora sp. NPDC002543]
MTEHEQLGAPAGPEGHPVRPERVPPQAPAPEQREPGARPGPEGDGAAAPWPDMMLPLLRTPTADRRPAPEGAGAEPPTGVEPARVLDLALLVGELLLASGEAAEDVEAAMLAVVHAYRLHPCDPQVTFTRVAISYQPGPSEPSLSAECSVRRPAVDYARLAAVFRLVTEITVGGMAVPEAHGRLVAARRHSRRYSGRLFVLSCAGMAGAATLLIGGRADARAWLVFTSAVVAALMGERFSALVARHDFPAFYQFVAAAVPAAVIGILLSFNGLHLRGSVVITGGLYAVLPGWPMVAAAQDGLTGFYLTAAARLLEALYLMAGVVIGVMTVLYVGVNNGADLAAQNGPPGAVNPPLQLAAAVLLTLAFAVLLNTEPATLPAVLLNSAAGWSTYGVLVNAGGEPILATGLAAGLVGLSGQLMARCRGSSALPHITAALGPLLPGSVLYFGMLAFVRGEPEVGLSGIGRAGAMAMALAIGVNLGRELARLFLPVPRVAAPPRRRGGRHRR